MALRTGLLAALLLLITALAPANGEIKTKIANQPIPVLQAEVLPVGVVFISQKERQPIGSAWNTLMEAASEAPQLMIAARLEEEAGWSKWLGQTKLLMSVRKDRGSAELQAVMLDRQTCECIPSDSSRISKQYEDWREQQETHWTLASAIVHYERINKKWPEKLDELIRPYPNNFLSGERSGMRSMFNSVKFKVKNAKANKDKAAGAYETGKGNPSAADEGRAQNMLGGSSVGSNGLMDKDWSQPLEIIVDKATHQLAVIQGNIIVRSYRVGLGGEETPEGRFYISEKVKNPNGRDDGVFGSRGMTLSKTLYAIHGTDEPDSIGKDESLGCVRMSKADVEELFDMVPLGTVVKIKNGTLPSKVQTPAERFKLEPRQNETNPAKVYKWLT